MDAPPSRPPDSVAFVARTHWLVGAVALTSVTALHLLTRNLQRVTFSPHTYQIAIAITLLYLVGGTTVWFGTPLGRFLSHVCGLLYLVRPQLGDRVWRIMRSEEFKAHFRRQP
jgi:hypothetical protein